MSVLFMTGICIKEQTDGQTDATRRQITEE